MASRTPRASASLPPTPPVTPRRSAAASVVAAGGISASQAAQLQFARANSAYLRAASQIRTLTNGTGAGSIRAGADARRRQVLVPALKLTQPAGTPAHAGPNTSGALSSARAPPRAPAAKAAAGVDFTPPPPIIVPPSRPSIARAASVRDDGVIDDADYDAVAADRYDELLLETPTRGLCWCTHSNPVRSICLHIVASEWVQAIILAAIIASSAIQCAADPLQPPEAPRNALLSRVTIPFNIFFTVETVIKIIAYGVLGPKSYFYHPWNTFDLLVVLITWASTLSSASQLGALRIVRLLRALTFSSGIRIVLTSTLKSVPSLINVSILTIMCLSVFALMGLSLWQQVLQGNCAYVDPYSGAFTFVSGNVPCALPCPDPSTGCTEVFGDACTPALVSTTDTSSNAVVVVVNTTCNATLNPDFGQTSFDNFGYAFLTSFVFITTEGWTGTVYTLWHTYGQRWLVSTLSVAHVIITTWVVLELCLAIISGQYMAAVETERAASDRLRALVREAKHRAKSGFAPIIRNAQDAGMAVVEMMQMRREARASLTMTRRNSIMALGAQPLVPPAQLTAGAAMATASAGKASAAAADDDAPPRMTCCARTATNLSNCTLFSFSKCMRRTWRASVQRTMSGVNGLPPVPSLIARPARCIVQHPLFDTITTSLVVANCVVLGGEFEGMPRSYEQALRVLNYIFVAAFTLELLLRTCALSFTVYFSQAFNVFDAAVVVAGVIDSATDGLGGAASVLRITRILRILRVARSWKALQLALADLARALPNAVNTSLVLVCLELCSATIGLELFGGGYQRAVNEGIIQARPRLHYEDLWTAFVAVFDVIDNENWNDQIHIHMAAFGTWASAFFIINIVLGNYLFLNIMIAALLGAYDRSGQQAAADADGSKPGSPRASSATSPRAGSRNESPTETPSGMSKRGTTTDLTALVRAVSDGDGRKDATPSRGAASPAKITMRLQLDGKLAEVVAMLPMQRTGEDRLAWSPTPEHGHTPDTVIRLDNAGRLRVQAETVDDSITALITRRSMAAFDASGDIPMSPLSPTSRAVNILSQAPGEAPSGRSGGNGSQTARPAGRSPAPNRAAYHKSASDRAAVPAAFRGATATVSPLQRATAAAAVAASIMASGNSSRTLQAEASAQGPDVNASTRHAVIPTAASASISLRSVPVSTPASGAPSTGSSMRQRGKSRAGASSPLNPSSRAIHSVLVASDSGGKSPRGVRSDSELSPPLEKEEEEDLDDSLCCSCTLPCCKCTCPACVCCSRRLWARCCTPLRACTGTVRLWCALLVSNPWFERFILVIILWSSINLALDEPRLTVCDAQDKSCNNMVTYLRYADLVVSTIFTLEMLLQMLARGLFAPKVGYFRDSWRILDFAIVGVSWASVATASGEIRALRAVRAMRALRPLRFVSKMESLKLVVTALIASVPRVANVSIVIMAFLYMFAVAGLQVFRGKFNACNDSNALTADQCTGTFNITGASCLMLPSDDAVLGCQMDPNGSPFPRVWAPQPQHFDNIGNALLTVWELATGENWPVLMLYAEDATSNGPVTANAPANRLYYVLAEAVINQFLIELFASTIIGMYSNMRAELGDASVLTPEQRQWVANMRVLLSSRPPALKQAAATGIFVWDACISFLFQVVDSIWFRHFGQLVVLGNICVMASANTSQDGWWVLFYWRCDLAFAIYFAVETLVFLACLGPKQYWRRLSNRFDLILAIGSVAGVCVPRGIAGAILRLFPVVRIFRLARWTEGLRSLSRTLMLGLPAFLNVAGLLMLDVFVFAVVGMNLFGRIRVGASTYYTADGSFNDFGTSVFTLLRSSTGENFNGIMHDLTIAPPYCVPNGPNANCGVVLGISALYFTIYFSFTAWVVVSMLAAAVIEAFDETSENEALEGGVFRLTHKRVLEFKKEWGEQCSEMNDPRVTARGGGATLPVWRVVKLVARLAYPLGVRREMDTAAADDASGGGGDRPASPASDRTPSPTQAPNTARVSRYTVPVAEAKAQRLVDSLPLVPDHRGHLHYHAVLHALIDRASVAPALGRHIDSVAVAAAGARRSREGDPRVLATLRELRAATLIRAAWQHYKKRKTGERSVLRARDIVTMSVTPLPVASDATSVTNPLASALKQRRDSASTPVGDGAAPVTPSPAVARPRPSRITVRVPAPPSIGQSGGGGRRLSRTTHGS